MKRRSLLSRGLVATILVANIVLAGSAAPEVTWSVMHPTELDPAYMARVAAKAVEYGGVDSFEVCGKCHSGNGGLDGLLMFEPYARTAAACDRADVAKNRAVLKAVIAEAHKVGKKLYYWHREGFLPKGILEDLPALRDVDGEIDLLGEAYASFLRWKVGAALDTVPELDGFVLTLTEADFSVVHNSRADRYPPPKVVETIVRIFCEEHEKRGKRFVLRSFGSVAKDYEDIIAGGAAAAKDHRFEIETKATPYDFSPFLPDNPFLRKTPGTTLGVECDGLGEFLGAGFPACTQTHAILRYVRAARKAGTDRYTIRIDRVGNSIFDSAQELNLYAYMRFIRDPRASQATVEKEWAAKRWPNCPDEMIRLAHRSFDVVAGMEFVKGNVTFHQHPVAPSFKFLKAGGVFSTYRDNADLHMACRLWGILSETKTPGRRAIVAEKENAARAAADGLKTLVGLKDKLDPDEYARQHRAWSVSVKATRATLLYTRCAAAYFDDMDGDFDEPFSLAWNIGQAEHGISAMMADPSATERGFNLKHSEAVGTDLDRVYFIPLRWLCREFANEYRAERKVRAALQARTDVADFVVPGGIYDDNRVDRPMHGSYPELKDGVPVRWIGNTIFPNGTIVVEFDAKAGDGLEVALSSAGAQALTLSVNGGAPRIVTAGSVLPLGATGKVRVEIGKSGATHPAVISLALVRKDANVRKTEVRVSDFGFDPTNATRFVQAAINSRARRVIIDRQASPWIVEPLVGVSDQEIVFEKGVEVQALRGAFRDKNDCLLTFSNAHDVRLVGGEGATLRMWRDDYLKPPYAKAEWRHCVKFLSVLRGTVEGLALRDSGGDGLYVADRRNGPPCRDIVARRVVSDGNARQGSSLITVENLLYEDCVFSNTAGRPPQDGIDIEPNGKDEIVRNCVFRRCRFENNKSTGFAIALFHHDETSDPISVQLEDCVFKGNVCGFCYCQNAREARDVRGDILLKGCRFEQTREAAISLSRKAGAALTVGIVDCAIENCCTGTSQMAEVQVSGFYGPSDSPDRIAFRNLKVVQPVERRWIDFSNVGYGPRLPKQIVGNVTVTSPAGTQEVVLDAAYRAAELPVFWSEGEPPRRPLAVAVEPVDRCPGKLVKLAAFRPRGKAWYVFFAPAAGTVHFSGHIVRIGKKPLDAPQFEVRSYADGKRLADVPLSDKKGTSFEVTVPSAGLYTLRADLGGHSFVMTEADVPAALDLSEEPASFMGVGAGGWIWAKEGADFNVAVSGEGYGERVGAELFDPSGKSVWNEASAACWRGARVRKAAEGLWKIVTRSPKGARAEDNHLDVVGAVNVVFLAAEKYWK